mgnify:FL=1
MIIWIDGTFGVGKTVVAYKVKEMLNFQKVEILRSDYFYQKIIIDNRLIGGGALPQNNIAFIKQFKKIIEEKLKCKDIYLIIDMALTENECKEMLLEYFLKKGINIKHFILIASIETIKSRIGNDKKRDKEFAISHLSHNQKFLDINYKDAIRIDTENKNVGEVAKEIINLL